MYFEALENSSIPYYLAYIVPLLLLIGYTHENPWMTFLPALFVFFIVPLADFILENFLNSESQTSKEPTKKTTRVLEERQSFRIPLYLWVPVQQYLLFWSASKAFSENSLIRLAGLALSMGLISAGGINCAHELLHKESKEERFLGKLLLCSVLYGHFYVEHARGHHRKVGTMQDPATARFGESIYHFLPRTLCESFKSAWKLEGERLKTKGCSIWTVQNELLWFHVVSIGYVFLITWFHGAAGLTCFIVQAAIAILLLEEINFIEHYGLQRKRLQNGSFEAVGPQHSWDAPQAVSGYLLFKLQSHADHHLHSRRRYQALQLSPGSPRLPAGYTALIPIVLIPPLWRALMDPRVPRYRKSLLKDSPH